VILDVGERPTQYNPGRRSLAGYLLMAARGDLINALKSERLRSAHLAPLDDVELRPPARNTGWTSSADPAEAVIAQDDDARVAALRARFSGRDRDVVDLIIEGERRTDVFAEVLGL